MAGIEAVLCTILKGGWSMAKFEREAKTIHADWWTKREDGTPLEVCEIRRFGYGDEQILQGAMVRISEDDNLTLEWSGDVFARMNLNVLKRGIKSWTDEEGVSIPVTDEAMEALNSEDADFILKEIQAFNRGRQRSAAEQATFRGAD